MCYYLNSLYGTVSRFSHALYPFCHTVLSARRFGRAFYYRYETKMNSPTPSSGSITFSVPWKELDTAVLFDLVAEAPRSFPDIFLVLTRTRPVSVKDLRIVLVALERERVIEKNYLPTRNGNAPYAVSYSVAMGNIADLRARVLELATGELELSCTKNPLVTEAVLRSIRERSGRCFIELRAAAARAVGDPSFPSFDVALHLVDLYRSGVIGKHYWNLDGFAMETYSLPEE